MKQSIPLIQENSPQNINFFFKNNCRIKTICLIQKEENNRKSHKFSLFYLFQIKTLNKIDILRGGGCCPSCSNCPEMWSK
ncbi:unnamed protein product [Paramecium sonneborni]|uniref:Uncharacterized protein n=1 Tax=Paramecium sonneborni TaxID=65129 RepID=A0A8S1NMX4_9CILI|nr:unnamed protein product [Paramecium sonneborni]